MATSPVGAGPGHAANSANAASQSNAAFAPSSQFTRHEIDIADSKMLSLFNAAAEWTSAGSVPKALENMSKVTIAESTLASEDWKNAIEGTAQMTLPGMTKILGDFLEEAKGKHCKNLLLVGNHGQIILKPKNGDFKLYCPSVSQNARAMAAVEVHPAVNDQLTLSILKSLYGDNAVEDMLNVNDDPESTDTDDSSSISSTQTGGEGVEASRYYSIRLSSTSSGDQDSSDQDDAGTGIRPRASSISFGEVNRPSYDRRYSHQEPIPIPVSQESVESNVREPVTEDHQTPLESAGDTASRLPDAHAVSSAASEEPIPEMEAGQESLPDIEVLEDVVVHRETLPSIAHASQVSLPEEPSSDVEVHEEAIMHSEPGLSIVPHVATAQAEPAIEYKPLAAILNDFDNFNNDLGAIDTGADSTRIREMRDANSSLSFIHAMATQLNFLGEADIDDDLAKSDEMKKDLRVMSLDFMTTLAKPDHPWPSETKAVIKEILIELNTNIDREVISPVITKDKPLEIILPKSGNVGRTLLNARKLTASLAGFQDVDDASQLTEAQKAARRGIQPLPPVNPDDIEFHTYALTQVTIPSIQSRQKYAQPILDMGNADVISEKELEKQGIDRNTMKSLNVEVAELLARWYTPEKKDKVVAASLQPNLRRDLDEISKAQKKLNASFNALLMNDPTTQAIETQPSETPSVETQVVETPPHVKVKRRVARFEEMTTAVKNAPHRT